MCFVSLNRAVIRIDASELYVFAEVVTSILTKEAFAAGNTRLDGYAVT